MELSRFAAWMGGLMVPIGLLIGVGLEQYKILRKQEPDFVAPVVRAAIFAALLGGYIGLSNGIARVVEEFGSLKSSSDQVQGMFQARWEKFAKAVGTGATEEEKPAEDPSTMEKIGQFLGTLTPTSIFNVLFNFFTYITFLLVMAVVYILQKTQIFILGIAYGWGPICLGFAALHPFFNTLALSWFWTMVEVSAWGISMRILLNTLAGIDTAMADKMLTTYNTTDFTMTYADNVFVNIVYIVMLVSVPTVTSLIIRSHSASALGAKMIVVAGAGASSAASKLGVASIGHGLASAAKSVSAIASRKDGGESSSGGTSDGAAKGPDSGQGGRKGD